MLQPGVPKLGYLASVGWLFQCAVVKQNSGLGITTQYCTSVIIKAPSDLHRSQESQQFSLPRRILALCFEIFFHTAGSGCVEARHAEGQCPGSQREPEAATWQPAVLCTAAGTPAFSRMPLQEFKWNSHATKHSLPKLQNSSN